MFKEFLQILGEHGALASVIFVVIVALVNYVWRMKGVWAQRDKERTEERLDVQKDELRSHPFFTHAEFKISAEIPLLVLYPDEPVREEMFRDLLRYQVTAMLEVCTEFVEKSRDDEAPSRWAICANENVTEIKRRFEELSRTNGIPEILIKKYLVWQQASTETLRSYISSLAISKVYTTNNARTNTFLYLMNLVLSTTIADLEKTLSTMNGQLSGLDYKNKTVE